MQTKFTVNGGRVTVRIQRPATELVQRLGGFSTALLSDCLERMNVLDSGVRPMLDVRAHFAGPAFTVEEMEAGNLMSHLALKYVQAGDVLVIDGKGVTTRAGWGGLQMLSAKVKGVVAVILDGAVRDWDYIQSCGVPVYARAVTPAGPHKGWGGRVNEPVSCGGLVVCPGDLVVGDADGVVVIPIDRAEEVALLAAEKDRQEADWFRRVEQGQDTADFLGFVDLADKYNIKIRKE